MENPFKKRRAPKTMEQLAQRSEELTEQYEKGQWKYTKDSIKDTTPEGLR